MGALTPGLLDAQFPWGSILPERMSLYTDVQGMVQPRCPGRMAVPPGSLLGICCPSSASAAHASSHTRTSSGHIKSWGHQQVQNNTAELSSETQMRTNEALQSGGRLWSGIKKTSDFCQTATGSPRGQFRNARPLPRGFRRAFLGWRAEPAERLASKQLEHDPLQGMRSQGFGAMDSAAVPWLMQRAAS